MIVWSRTRSDDQAILAPAQAFSFPAVGSGGITPPPTPPSAPATGSGGGGRYYGYYPERITELRREIRTARRQYKATERRLKLAPPNADLARLAELLTELQSRLNALVVEYEELIHAEQAQEEVQENEALLIRIFADSYYEH